ncbi:MAG: ATP-binding protein [Acidobacteria bacterium]|nr:ATP-binding protein [Acidobacteriota bacterium]
MGETRVDLQHLLEDLRHAYTGALEETILTEVVANALDSGATRVLLLTNPADATLTIVDDGRGMQRRELARYHDVAASTKARGDGIGFAGVGIKLGLLVSREVVTETRRGATRVATRWHLASRHRAPWKWIPPPGLTTSRGTGLTLVNQLSPLLDAGYIEETIRRHFEPLLDSAFDDLLRRHYPDGVVLEVDGRELSRMQRRGFEHVPVSIRLGRRRTPSAIGFIERTTGLPADRDGIAISTFGKIIKRGWELARSRTNGSRADWRSHRSARPRRVSHTQQERLYSDGRTRGALPRVPQGHSGSRVKPAGQMGGFTRRRSTAPYRAARARPRARARGSCRRLSVASLASRSAPRRTETTADAWPGRRTGTRAAPGKSSGE